MFNSVKSFLNRRFSLPSVVAFILVSMLTACAGKDKAEMLLKTIPSSASAVIVINVDELIDDAGLDSDKISENSLNQLRQFCGDSEWSVIKPLFDGKSGLSMTVCGVFGYNRNFFFTAFVDDENGFIDYLKGNGMLMNKSGDGWESDSGHAVLFDGQFWYCDGTMDLDKAKYFKGLKEDDSFMSSDYASKLCDGREDVAFVADFESIYSLAGQSNSTMLRMVLGLLFDSPKYFAGTLDFTKGRVDLETNVLDEKFKKANTSMRLATLKESTLAAFPGKGDLYFAFNFSKEDIKQIMSQLGTGHMPDELMSMLNNFDGSVVIGMNLAQTMASGGKGGYLAQIGFETPEAATSAVAQISGLTPDTSVRTEGKYVLIDGGITPGRMQPAASEKLKGSSIGFVIDPSALPKEMKTGDTSFLKLVWMTATPKDGSLSLNFVVSTVPSDKNALETFINSYK